MTGFASVMKRIGFLRLPAIGAVHREWLHFVVHDASVDVVINFSVLGSPSNGTSGNVLLLARDRDGSWNGDVERFSNKDVRGGRGGLRLDVGMSSIRYDGAFCVRAVCKRADVSTELVIEPLSFPYLVHGAGNVQWLVAPRWRATGEVQVRGKRYQLDGAPAYHDHNWGDFAGGDVAWRWGCTLAAEGYNAVFVQLLDRARTLALSQGLFVWNGAHRERTFRASEVTFSAEGLLRTAPSLTVPRALSLLASSSATDVPTRIQIGGRDGDDRLEGAFECHDMARVLVPRDMDLGVTSIHEIKGRFVLDGMLGGEEVHIDAPAFAETLGWFG